jgi:hypothetical protein
MIDEQAFALSDLNQGHFVLGEYTTDEGPYLDDHFIVIAIAPSRFFEYSVGSSRCEEVLSYLKENLDVRVQFTLSNSTEWRSTVLYPDELRGHAFFTSHCCDSKGLTGRLQGLIHKRTRQADVSQLITDYLAKTHG